MEKERIVSLVSSVKLLSSGAKKMVAEITTVAVISDGAVAIAIQSAA